MTEQRAFLPPHRALEAWHKSRLSRKKGSFSSDRSRGASVSLSASRDTKPTARKPVSLVMLLIERRTLVADPSTETSAETTTYVMLPWQQERPRRTAGPATDRLSGKKTLRTEGEDMPSGGPSRVDGWMDARERERRPVRTVICRWLVRGAGDGGERTISAVFAPSTAIVVPRRATSEQLQATERKREREKSCSTSCLSTASCRLLLTIVCVWTLAASLLASKPVSLAQRLSPVLGHLIQSLTSHPTSSHSPSDLTLSLVSSNVDERKPSAEPRC